MIARRSSSWVIVEPSILRILKTLGPAMTARWPSADRSRHVMGAPAEYIVFCDALGRSWDSMSRVSMLSCVVVAGWPSSFLIIFPLAFILEDMSAFKEEPSWMCAFSEDLSRLVKLTSDGPLSRAGQKS